MMIKAILIFIVGYLLSVAAAATYFLILKGFLLRYRYKRKGRTLSPKRILQLFKPARVYFFQDWLVYNTFVLQEEDSTSERSTPREIIDKGIMVDMFFVTTSRLKSAFGDIEVKKESAFYFG